jgi:hypothetical protein
MAGLTVLAALALAAPARAQEEEGVFIDPDSPSGKEYQLPLESERRQADPSRKPSDAIVQGARNSPIFGAGIVTGDDGEAATNGAGQRPARPAERDEPAKGGSDAGREAQPRDAERDGDAEVLQAATSNPGPPDGGIGVPLTIGGVAVGVLLLGGLAGLLLRRRA